jgi:hypothetical protein
VQEEELHSERGQAVRGEEHAHGPMLVEEEGAVAPVCDGGLQLLVQCVYTIGRWAIVPGR